MRLASILIEGRPALGMGVGEGVIDLGAALAGDAPRDMIGLIETFDRLEPQLRRIQDEAVSASSPYAVVPLGAVGWLVPVPNPSKICCLALNNSANADRILSGPRHPATFVKPSSALTGHLTPILCRPEYGLVHPEPELALVIGRRASRITADQAMDHVFGYTIHNDITSPTMRGEDTFHYRAIHPGTDGRAMDYVETWVSYPGRYKCADTFSCMGPWLVARAAVDDPHDLGVRCSHQGRLVTEDNTGNLFFKAAETLAFLSSYMTLLPGDIVSMGTALKRSATGGAVQTIDLNRLGGPVSVAIDGLGELTNSVEWLD